MATWTDGPEYAPAERPDGFVAPQGERPTESTTPEVIAARPPAPADAVPETRPRPAFVATEPEVSLDSVAPPRPPQRDPRQAFDVAASSMTATAPAPLPSWSAPTGQPVASSQPVAGSAWGAVHAPTTPRPADSWAPDQPIPAAPEPPTAQHAPPPQSWPPAQVNPGGFPPSGPPAWQRPPAPGGFGVVSWNQLLAAITPGVVICLAVGTVVQPLSFPLLVVAGILAARIEYRRDLIRRMFALTSWTVFVLAIIALLWSYDELTLLSLYGHTLGWAQLGNLGLLVAVFLVVGDALRRGEEPQGPLR